jgi:DNA-binding PadR family transcriptional regulator
MELAERKATELSKRVELIGKKWEFLHRMSIKPYQVITLAKEMRKSPPEVCQILKRLEKEGLVESGSTEGKKLYQTTKYAAGIMAAITQSTDAQAQKEEKLEDWRLDELISILEDEKLSQGIRMSYSKVFVHVCTTHPAEVINNKSARRLLEEVVREPYCDKMNEELTKCMPYILPLVSDPKSHGNWILDTLYPIVMKNTEDASEKVKKWSIEGLGKIGSQSAKVRADVEKKLLEIWFSDEVDAGGDIGEEVKPLLSCLASKELFENVRLRAQVQDPKVRNKAEALLEELRNCLSSSKNADNADKQILVV